MNCEQMQTLFSPYLDKITTITENKAIEEHLGECAHCARQMEEMGRMFALLRNLDTPQIPADFGEKLHKQISHEKIKLFPVHEPTTPKRTSWIAAAVAGLAISVGIFASSYLPYGTMEALLNDWMNKDNKQRFAIVDNNKILQDWINNHIDKEQPENGGQITNPAGQNENNSKSNNGTDITPSVSKPPVVAVQERVKQNYTAKIQVNDIDESMQDVIRLAYANDAQMSVTSSNIMSVTTENVKVVTMQVHKDKADDLLKELGSIGVEAPLQNNITYTEAYTENQKALANLGENIQKMQSSDSLNDMQKTQLQSMLKQKQDLETEQERINKAVDSVTVEICLVEKTNS